MTRGTRRDGPDWTFPDISTNRYTHAVHLYPARMHPEIARRLLARHAADGDVVPDPFMGSGGVLLEGVQDRPDPDLLLPVLRAGDEP